MKKLILSFCLMAFAVTLSFGQDATADSWVDNGAAVETSSQVNILSTAAPASFLVNRSDGSAAAVTAGNGGGVFRFASDPSSGVTPGSFKIQSQPKAEIIARTGVGITPIVVVESGAGANTLFIGENGNVGIGTDSPSQKFSINGTANSTEFKVEASVEAPDYVFKSDYNLRSLEEVENYINENSHLPEIPSAAEFKEDGIYLGKMSFDLLKKVEELTLYMIEMKKENENLKSRISELEKSK